MFETVRKEFMDILEHFFEIGIVVNDRRGDTKAEIPLVVFTFLILVMIRISFRFFVIVCAVFTFAQAHCFLRKHTGEMIDVSPAELFRVISGAFTH